MVSSAAPASAPPSVGVSAPSGGRGPAVRALAAIAGGGALWWLSSVRYNWPFIGDCWFRHLTGVPCPGCGMGRAFNALLRGDWARALAWHPLVLPFGAALAISVGWLAVDAARRRNTFFPALHRATSGVVVRAALLLAVAAVWGWNLWRGVV